MHSITLMRHGRLNLPAFGWLTAADMQRWIAAYDLAEIITDAPSTAALRLAASVAQRISSPLPRALTSMAALGHQPTLTDAIFREAALPYPPWHLLRLPPAIWAVFLRRLWLAGYSAKGEPRQAARQRAQDASDRLAILASNGPLLLMGTASSTA